MYSYHKPKWVMLEGPDRSGKTSAYDWIFFPRCGIDTISDRGLLSSAFFHPSLAGREYNIQMLVDWLSLSTSRLIVFNITYETQQKRLVGSDHKPVSKEAYLSEMTFYTIYGKYVHDLYPDKVLLLDANRDASEVRSDILKFLAQDEVNE